jgi:hypothetical protein
VGQIPPSLTSNRLGHLIARHVDGVKVDFTANAEPRETGIRSQRLAFVSDYDTTTAQTPATMAGLPRMPKYYILTINLPWPPLVTMADLQEREPLLASAVYPATPRDQASGEPMRHNLTKLLMARWGYIDPSKYTLITGQVNDQDQITQAGKIKRWAENIQTSWIGAPSWMQRYMAGAGCWYDYQVLMNRLNRNVQLLSIVPHHEPHQARMQRRL